MENTNNLKKQYVLIDDNGNKYLRWTLKFLEDYIKTFKFRFFYLNYINVMDEESWEVIKSISIKNIIIQHTKKLQEFEEAILSWNLNNIDKNYLTKQKQKTKNFIDDIVWTKSPQEILEDFLNSPVEF